MKGIGGSTIAAELDAIQPTAQLAQPIQKKEFQNRIDKACQLMQEQQTAALYLHAGVNLYYFTGLKWNSSERMVGAILFSNGTLLYIAPEFEKGTIFDFMLIAGGFRGWEEHESPYQLFVSLLKENGITTGNISIDEATPFFIFDGIRNCQNTYKFINAKPITAGCRMIKSPAEISIIQHAMNITLEVQKAVARVLRVGISAKEISDFINDAHIKHGAPLGSYFCIVLFGVDTSFPHGVKAPKNLEENEVVLIDTGCSIHDYISDITRTYVFGTPNEEQTRIWNIEKEALTAVFDAAQLGNTCSDLDVAARSLVESHGLGPAYKLPGLPHRTGHGIGLEIHEWPYILSNDSTVLKPGMTFSNEPMICLPGKFGIRHEDHIYMTDEGPKWFTKPMYSLENPFDI
jgi:Xaa-Pro dipeptidase